ncbi:E3 ubiquitin/ISG15 ligase TRIM25-like isoform X2 [Hyperolius riggenbachi]|uniref:E3 ubiquitin/ISG15 ligase TRIM25-like isoform X2 n=1 Tax=Hyperolius riggenbachi TaxID=752182 RepID=UPI0035A2B4D2
MTFQGQLCSIQAAEEEVERAISLEGAGGSPRLSEMASLREELLCSICLNIYKDPVTLKCGHSFCNVCVDAALNAQEGYEGYSCPECRELFPEWPAVRKDITLSNIVEKFLSNQPDEEKSRDFCSQFPEPDNISCMHCQNSLCEDHLRIHNKAPEHVLRDPTTPLEGSRSFLHLEGLTYSCAEEAACVSTPVSLVGTRWGNQVASLAKASKRMTPQPREIMREIEEIEIKIKRVEECKKRAQEKTDREIEEIISWLTYDRRKMKDQEMQLLIYIIREADQVSQIHDSTIWQLKVQKCKLTRKMRHTEEPSSVTDPLLIHSRERGTCEVCDRGGGRY